MAVTPDVIPNEAMQLIASWVPASRVPMSVNPADGVVEGQEADVSIVAALAGAAPSAIRLAIMATTVRRATIDRRRVSTVFGTMPILSMLLTLANVRPGSTGRNPISSDPPGAQQITAMRLVPRASVVGPSLRGWLFCTRNITHVPGWIDGKRPPPLRRIRRPWPYRRR